MSPRLLPIDDVETHPPRASAESLPSLINRFYGLMLGFFLAFMQLDVPEDVYQAHRARINEVLAELDIPWELEPFIPETHAEFILLGGKISRAWMASLPARSAELLDFFRLGYFSLWALVGADDDQGAARRNVDAAVHRYELDTEALGALLEPGWDDGRIDDELYSALLSRFYRLSMIAVWPLKPNKKLCFVIMPFSSPFREYYSALYRPALQQAGLDCIRAWVGLANEHYLSLLATLLSRCGAALADVSAVGNGLPNLNVIHEIGLNMGMTNVTFLIHNEEPVQLPSNFTGLVLAEYTAGAVDFPDVEAARLGGTLSDLLELHTAT